MWSVLAALADPPVTACCTSAAAREELGQYLRFTSSLATPGSRKFDGVLWAWEPIARRHAEAAPTDERAVYTSIADAVHALKGPIDRDAAVAALPALSRAMTWLVVRHAGGTLSVVEGACDDGRTWLQEPGPLASPYGCGSFTGR